MTASLTPSGLCGGLWAYAWMLKSIDAMGTGGRKTDSTLIASRKRDSRRDGTNQPINPLHDATSRLSGPDEGTSMNSQVPSVNKVCAIAIWHSRFEYEFYLVNGELKTFGSYQQAWDYIYRNPFKLGASAVEIYQGEGS